MSIKQNNFQHRISCRVYGFAGFFVTLLLLATCYWVFTFDKIPTFVKIFSVGGCGLCALYFLKVAWTNFSSTDHFETSIIDGQYTQKIPRKNHFQSFQVSINEIDYIEKKIRSGKQTGSTTFIVLKNGQKRQITNTYWNPISKITKHLQTIRPEIKLRISRPGSITVN